MSKLRSFIRDAVRNTVRKVLGKPELPKPRIIKAPLFGSRRALLRLFGLGIKWQAQLQRARFKSRRRGISAKSPHARYLGGATHRPQKLGDDKIIQIPLAGSRRRRATGRNSYAERSPQQDLNAARRDTNYPRVCRSRRYRRALTVFPSTEST